MRERERDRGGGGCITDCGRLHMLCFQIGFMLPKPEGVLPSLYAAAQVGRRRWPPLRFAAKITLKRQSLPNRTR